MLTNHKIGPYFPSLDKPVTYCMAGDEPLMFLPKYSLNPKQLNHLNMMRYGILPYAMAAVPFSNSHDNIVLDSAFLKMKSLFDQHLECYVLAGITYSANIYFAPTESLYQKAITISDPEQMICCVCYSHELNDTINIQDRLDMSKQANSKIHLISNAQNKKYQIPQSFIVSKQEILEKQNSLFNDYPSEVLCKADGLGGGYNVGEIKNFNDLMNEIDNFTQVDQFVIQQKIDKSIYTEYAIDFIMKESGAEFYSARKKLTYNNQWFGNLFEPNVQLNDIQKKNLDLCLQHLRDTGYFSQDGYVCCVDVLQNDTAQYILEINARWSGGFPIAKFLKKINYQANVKITAYIDYISLDELDQYIQFVKHHLLSINNINIPDDEFKVFPTGFCPVANDNKICVWLSVFGNFDAFSKLVANQFSNESFTMAKFALEYH